MIRCVAGGVGSGKTLSAIKMMIDRNHVTFVNQDIKIQGAERLKVEHIIKKELVETPSGKGKPKVVMDVNWDFWKDQVKNHKGFDIVLDEAQNLINARRAMSSFNVKMVEWVSQIRKIMGSSERNDLIFITQRVERIDVASRDLLHEIIYCEKFFITPKGQWIPGREEYRKYAQKVKTKTWNGERYRYDLVEHVAVVQYHFIGEQCMQAYEAYRAGLGKTYNYRTWFYGNNYMQYYNSYEIVTFGNSVYL